MPRISRDRVTATLQMRDRQLVPKAA